MAATGFFLYYHRQIDKKLREVGATSEETVKTIEELKRHGLSQLCINFLKDSLRRGLAQIAGNKIKETSDGRYYMERKDGKHC